MEFDGNLRAKGFFVCFFLPCDISNYIPLASQQKMVAFQNVFTKGEVTMKQDLKIIIGVGLVFGICVAGAGDVVASTSTGMPWEGPLSQLLKSLEGPMARVLGAASIIVLGLSLAFSEGGSIMKKALWVAMGLSIAFNATSWGLEFFGFSGGLLV